MSISAGFLRPQHFPIEAATTLTARGLRYSQFIGADDWLSEGIVIDGFDGTDEHSTQWAKRDPTKVVVNPRTPSCSSLKKIFLEAKKSQLPDEPINVGYGLSSKYQLGWEREKDDDDVCESQDLIVVAMALGKVVGYSALGISVRVNQEERSVRLFVQPDLVYVMPDKRRMGYGIDLSIACGRICYDLMNAIYAAAPANYLIEALVYADYESEGGVQFTQHLHGSIEFAADMLKELGRRRSVRVGPITLDAAF